MNTTGTADLVGYPAPVPRAWHRPFVAVAATRTGSWLLARTMRHVDRVLARRSGHRHSATGLLTGLPVVHLTTTGARTGLARTSALIPVRLGRDLAVLGTNFGGEATPGWVFNLLTEPRAVLAYDGREEGVRARPATEQERGLVLALAAQVYRGFAVYPRRATHRRIHVFVLESPA